MSARPLISDHVVKVELGQRPFRLTGDSGTVYTCDALIIATGAQAQAGSGCRARTQFKGFGVSACATCDGFFFRNKEVVVVGGGNTAVEEALYLANLASKVTVVHRRDSFRAERILQDRLFAHPKVKVIWDSAIEEICGTQNPPTVTHVRLQNVKTGALTDVKTDGVFVAIGHKPGDRAFRRPGRHAALRLHRRPARPHRDQHSRRVRGRRRHRRNLPPGRHGRRSGLHGRARGGKVACRAAPRTPGRRIMPLSMLSSSLDWDKVRIFYTAAEAGSFTHAGDSLGLSQSAVSRQVGALERDLAVPLFHRHARGLILTEQGELLFRTAKEMMLKLEATRARLTDSRERPNGDLRVTTTLGLGANWLTPRLGEFLDLYPEVRVQLLLTDEELDLAMREADVAIRLRQPVQGDLIQRRLFTVHFHAYASADYIKGFGQPKDIAELEEHRILTYRRRHAVLPAGRALADDRRARPQAPAPGRAHGQQHHGPQARGRDAASASPCCPTIWSSAEFGPRAGADDVRDALAGQLSRLSRGDEERRARPGFPRLSRQQGPALDLLNPKLP